MPGTSSSSSIPDARSWRKDLKTSSCLRRHKRKSHKKERMKRMFLEKDDLPAEEELTEESENWSIVNSHGEEEWEDANGKNSKVKTREESWEIQEEPEDSWGCPLTSDDLSSGNSDTETESSSSTSYQSRLWGSSNETQSQLTGHSGMILKLRKVFHSKGQKGRGTHHYQAVTDVSDDQRGSTRDKNTDQRQDGKKRHNVSRHGGRLRARVFSPALHSSNLRRSFAQIKYCSYLSTCHSTDHRRRWVLRSAVQTARRTMKNRYPDLVGKRIRHLYEEKDKTEVWYKGVVLRIHEPHPNPLKTVFEVKYDSEPEWQYYLELLVDYKKGWLKVED
ncbi:uncharacterized protein C15orf39 homolog isoform X2 [Chanos chanos]|nr:uncharacterized protein C15orf39 homolog isoform X2 [Chanos chanos]